MSSFLWTSMTCTVFKDSGKTPCTNDQLMIKLSGVDKILTLSLRMVTGILNGPKAFPLFNWHMSLCTSSSLVALSRNEFNELSLRKFLNGLLESRMVFDKLGPIFNFAF